VPSSNSSTNASPDATSQISRNVSPLGTLIARMKRVRLLFAGPIGEHMPRLVHVAMEDALFNPPSSPY